MTLYYKHLSHITLVYVGYLPDSYGCNRLWKICWSHSLLVDVLLSICCSEALESICRCDAISIFYQRFRSHPLWDMERERLYQLVCVCVCVFTDNGFCLWCLCLRWPKYSLVCGNVTDTTQNSWYWLVLIIHQLLYFWKLINYFWFKSLYFLQYKCNIIYICKVFTYKHLT